MKKYLLIILSIVIFSACGKQNIKTNQEDPDVLKLSGKSAVFIMINDQEREQYKKEMGEEDFYVAADDAMWYFAEARDYLKSKGYKTETTQANIIMFTDEHGKVYTINRRIKQIGYWRYILFNGVDEPIVVYPIEVESQHKAYVEK